LKNIVKNINAVDIVNIMVILVEEIVGFLIGVMLKIEKRLNGLFLDLWILFKDGLVVYMNQRI
jgi:uncharacterized membrane protein YqgA involved in biofilm formation